ncbi:MAG: hypothetical protein ACD_83C00006G0001 [uncultured bacterium]
MDQLSCHKSSSLKLSKQAQGTLLKVIEMIENDTYCPETIQQIESVIGLLKSAKRDLLSGHLDSCLVDRLSKNKDQTIKELVKIYNLTA